MRLSLSTFQNTKIKEANLLLALFKKYIDAHDFNFSISDQDKRLFWNYYLLKETCHKKEYWKPSSGNLSTNEMCIDILVEYYLQLNNQLQILLDKREEKLLNSIIQRFYERLKIKPNPTFTESSPYIYQMGHLGLHG